MVGLVQLLIRETLLALVLGVAAVLLTGSGPVFGAIGFILSLATAGVYALGQTLSRRIPFVSSRSNRGQQILGALAGLLLGWLILVPLLGGGTGAAQSLVIKLIGLYSLLRFASELVWPVVPLRRPVIRDQVVAQAERVLGRGARPYATRPDGTLDEEAVSFLVTPEEAERGREELSAALAEHRVEVSLEGGELVIRPAPAPAETA
jgi:hypothetical protein